MWEVKRVESERLWIAVVAAVGYADVFGGEWDSDQLHRTRAGAEAEIYQIALAHDLSPIEWTEITEVWSIGRCHKIGRPIELYVAVVRGVRVPD